MDDETSPTKQERRSALRIAATIVVALTVFAQDVMGLLERGGVWSVVSAWRLTNAQGRIIDVDSSGLRSVITAVTCLALYGVFSLLNLDIRRRWPAVLVLLSMVGGSLTLDALADEPVVEQLMIAHGYQRCASGDHAVGSGRSRVWFDEFAATAADCHATSVGS